MNSLRFRNLISGTALIIMLGVFLSSEVIYAEVEPTYVPDEIIVKFNVEAAFALEQRITEKDEAQNLAQSAASSLPTSLRRLNEKYKVKKFTPIFRTFKKDRQRLEALKLNDEAFLSEEEKHLLKRLGRAPKDAKIPDLDRIYKLELEEGRSVEAAVAEYSQDTNVVYAQPNYIYKLCATSLPEVPYIPNDCYIENDGNPGYWKEGSWEQDYPDLWGLREIQAIETWNIFDTDHNGIIDGAEKVPGEGVIVAVIDSGVDYNQEDLAENIWINEDEITEEGRSNGFIFTVE